MGYLRTAGNRWAVTLALFALFIKILVPIGQAIPIGQDENGSPIPLVVCTLYGTSVLNSKTGKEAPDKRGSQETCPVCAAFSITGTLDVDIGARVNVPQTHVASLLLPAKVDVLSQFLPGSRTARAPPTSA
jgi:hypothetical protein